MINALGGNFTLAAPQRLAQFSLPLQVAAVCYRLRDDEVEFLLV